MTSKVNYSITFRTQTWDPGPESRLTPPQPGLREDPFLLPRSLLLTTLPRMVPPLLQHPGARHPNKYFPTQRIIQKQSCYYHLHAKDEILEVLACVSHPHSIKKRPRQEQISSRGREELQKKKLLFAPKQSNCVSLRFIRLAHLDFLQAFHHPPQAHP